jgi:peptidoglycan/LPS O-acetylase OafA/YrhL
MPAFGYCQMNPIEKNRIAVLDGFRALAILMVIGFHYLANPSQFQDVEMLYPFGHWYADQPFLKYGYLGVDLFFIISGFVIAMTLESTGTWVDFAVKRFARLFPPMLLCTTVTYIGLQLLPQRVWMLNPVDLLPGLTFIDEMTWRGWLGPHVRIVEIVYWTLFVEVKFYILAAALYYAFRRVPLLVSLGLVFNAVWIATRFISSQESQQLLKDFTVYDKLPWFLAGVGFWCLNEHRYRHLAGILILEMLGVRAFRMAKTSSVERSSHLRSLHCSWR